jgi:hypothetical protein
VCPHARLHDRHVGTIAIRSEHVRKLRSRIS